MATDLFAEIVRDIQTPLDAWLTEHGAEPQSALARPTRAGSGDLAMACHRYARAFRKAPQAIAVDLAKVAEQHPLVVEASPVAGFLNLRLDAAAVAQRTLDWALADDGALGRSNARAGQTILVEYSSPNTNKPQHLGHCRNNILGSTVATLLETTGAKVVRVNLINDRGIHICKSMVAYRHFGEGITPEAAGEKGDHLVGDFYVKFDKAFRAEHAAYLEAGGAIEDKDAYFNSDDSALGKETRGMLQAWEQGDADVRALWTTMNGWCEAGFAQTYARMGVRFDQIYKESNTYLLGKDLVDEGKAKGIFYAAQNGAMVFDLSRIGLEGEKAVLRSDGTSVYTTQDLGTAIARHDEHAFDRMIYVVGNEQDHHFKVLFGILGALRPELEGTLHHLSYGMVELPEGKMKSREGTVVDADDLMDALHADAVEAGRERWPDLDADELSRRGEVIGIGGLKFYLLNYAPQTTFTFDPQKSIDLKGETAAYCLYAYARATSILRKLADADRDIDPDLTVLEGEQPRAVIDAMLAFPGEVEAAARELKPSLLTKAAYGLAAAFATFYNNSENRVLGAEPGSMAARAALVRATRRMLGGALDLLGITPLEEM